MKKITLYLVLIFINNCFADLGMGSDVGVRAMNIAGPIIQQASQEVSTGLKEVGLKTVEATLPAVDKLTNTVATLSGKLDIISDKLAIGLKDAGANAGIAVADKIGSTFNAGLVGVKTAGASAKALAMANPVITTVVVGTVIVVILTYGSYKIYRYYQQKKLESSVNEARAKLEIAKAQAKIAKLKLSEEKTLKEVAFKQSLMQHASSTQKTPDGIPLASQKAAQEFAIVAGQKKADKTIKAFNQHSIQTA